MYSSNRYMLRLSGTATERGSDVILSVCDLLIEMPLIRDGLYSPMSAGLISGPHNSTRPTPWIGKGNGGVGNDTSQLPAQLRRGSAGPGGGRVGSKAGDELPSRGFGRLRKRRDNS
jgi:hypothetical protein